MGGYAPERLAARAEQGSCRFGPGLRVVGAGAGLC